MNTRILLTAVIGIFFFTSSLPSQAALVGRLPDAQGVYQAIYDTDLNVTWLANANLAATDTFGVSNIGTGTSAGAMAWSTASQWIGAMNTANYFGFSDWRLPTTLQPDPSCSVQGGPSDPPGNQGSTGYGCTGSEMGHLLYQELGGTPFTPISSAHNANFALFQNIASMYYWSGTEYASDPTDAWMFGTYFLDQFPSNKADLLYAWAVRSGDVTAVPVPSAVWLLVSGLVMLAGRVRRRIA